MSVFDKAKEAVKFIEDKLKKKNLDNGQIAITLGSGLGKFGEKLNKLLTIPYSEIPNFPQSTVVGHKGALTLAKDEKTNKNFWVMQGRVHYYEGYSMEEVTFPIRMFSVLGVERMLVTNAAGGVNRYFDAGDLMLIKDHINMFGTNPLIGKNCDEFGTRFPDMSYPYSERLSSIIKEEALSLSIDLKEGVYFGWTGPSFETATEVKMVSVLGGDAVGMSTVPEVIVARHSGIEVAGISFISNQAAGISNVELSHEEVTENAVKVEEKFSNLVQNIVPKFIEVKK